MPSYNRSKERHVNINLTQKRLEHIIDGLPVGLMVFDGEMHLMLYNEPALELTGIGIENVLSGDYLDIVDEEVRGMLTAVSSAAGPTHLRKLIERDGKAVSYTIQCVADDIGSDTILIVEDATKYMEIEKIKRDFISTLLHKLRGPLSTLKTSLAMLQGGVVEGNTLQAREILEMGYHEVNRLATLVNDMRDMFLIETGLVEKEMDIEEFPISAPLDRAVEELAKTGPPFNSVRRRLVIDGRFTSRVTTDFEKLKKVFAILLKNALMYSPETKKVTVACEERDTDIEIRVEDRGIGIGEKNLPFLFGKYFRETNQATREHEGNGLGLFIAKSLIERMNGTIFCESIQGKGCVFSFSLPHSGAGGNG